MARYGLSLLALLLLATPVMAQEPPPGVELATRYTVRHKIALAVRPFLAPASASQAAAQMHQIVQRDLDFSDRFTVMPVPQQLAGGAVDYPAWNSLNVVYLVTGEIAPSPSGFRLTVQLHDVVYGTVRQTQTFAIPAANSPNFRMAVHVISDEIVRWATGQPGKAATQVLFTRQNVDGSSDLLIVDSDGENLRRILGSGAQRTIYSPNWSGDGRRLLYILAADTEQQLIERDLATGTQRTIHRARGNRLQTPTYVGDGARVAFGFWNDTTTTLYEYDAARGCCMRRLTRSPRRVAVDMSPAVSPDGRQMAFISDRNGTMHIYVMPVSGQDNPTLITPSISGARANFYSPSWSPTGTQLVFHGSGVGKYQIMVADAARPGGPVEQLTSAGRNEDPSWAPDGRHIVFTAAEGLGGGPPGLYVIDTVTGRTRMLVQGTRLRMADWSPTLVRGSDIVARP
jgi:TolB protein